MAATPDARVKASLRRLAGDDEAVIERAAASTDRVADAAVFVDRVGLDRLAAAVEATDDPELEARGRRALAAFRRFRAAASGEDHFRRGRGTDLRPDAEPPSE